MNELTLRLGRPEKPLPYERLPEDDRGCVDVAPARHFAIELLGRHVPDLPLDDARRRSRSRELARRLRDAEVEDPRPPVDADDDVLRRDIPMDEPERFAHLVGSLVRRVQPGESIDEDRRDAPNAHGLAPLPRGAQEMGERSACHVLHHEQELTPRGDHVERRDHVRMRDPSGEARLLREHLDERGVPGEMRVEPRVRDRAREPCVTDDAPEVHRRHPSRGDLLAQLVATEPLRARGGRDHRRLVRTRPGGRGRRRGGNVGSDEGKVGPEVELSVV